MTGQATPAGAAAPDLDAAVTALLHVAKAAVEATQWAKGGQVAEAAWLLANQLRGHLADAAEALGLTAVRGEVEAACLAIVRAEDVTDEDVEAGYEAAVDMGGDETLSGWEAVRAVLQTDRARVAARLAAAGCGHCGQPRAAHDWQADRVVCPDGAGEAPRTSSTLADAMRASADVVEAVPGVMLSNWNRRQGAWEVIVTGDDDARAGALAALRRVSARYGAAPVHQLPHAERFYVAVQLFVRGVRLTPWIDVDVTDGDLADQARAWVAEAGTEAAR